MHADVLPPDAAGVGVEGLPGARAVQDVQLLAALLVILQLRQVGHPRIDAHGLFQPPPAQVVAHRDHAWLDPFGDPHLVHEIADLSRHADQLAGLHAQPARVDRVHPDRVLVADLVEPLGVGAAGVDQRRQAEVGQKEHLAPVAVDVVRTDVACQRPRDQVLTLRPAPAPQRVAVELQLAAGRLETNHRLAVHQHADGFAVFDYPLAAIDEQIGVDWLWLCCRLSCGRVADIDLHARCADMYRCAGCWLWLAGVNARHALFKRLVVLGGDLEHAVLAHEGQRRQALGGRGLWQAGHAVLEYPAIVFLHRHHFARPVRAVEPLAHAQAAIRVHGQRQLDPQLVLLPDLARIGFVRVTHRLARPFHRHAAHRLAKGDPLAGVRLLAHQVVALAGVAHG